MAVKIFVVDTNVLMDAPDAMYGFDDNIVYLTGTVLQELDKHKGAPGEVGHNVRLASRMIDQLTSGYDLLSTVFSTDHYGEIRLYAGGKVDVLPSNFSRDVADNRILNDTLAIMHENPGTDVYLVTNDRMMRINARTVGIKAQPYKNVRIQEAESYTGRGVINLSQDDADKLRDDISRRAFSSEDAGIVICENDGEPIGYENQYFIINDENGGQLAGQYRDGKLYGISFEGLNPYGVNARNVGQSFALHALMMPVERAPLVILEGRAGTAKTFLSLAAGLDKVYSRGGHKKGRGSSYAKIVYTRPNQLSDNDHGYLKGDLFEKMLPLLGPMFDNLEKLISGDSGEDPEQVKLHIEDMIETGIIEPLSMAYMRGRSISDAFIIVDEAQNCTRGQIYDIISRAGENTKVVLCGDSNQVDNPVLDKWNNGLSTAISRLKVSKLAYQVTFDGEGECVRSALAAEATRLLSK